VSPNSFFNYIGNSITKFIKNTNYSIVDKFVGHGCGIKFHEDPKICHYVDEKFKDFGPRMEPGMIFTIEPMINIGSPDCIILEDNWTAITVDNKLSAQFEHMILCTNTGYEILTIL
jgi:methionyl aminopeptidase